MDTEKLSRGSDGALLALNPWRVIRQLYASHAREISNTIEMRASLRAGAFAFPGGYELAYVTIDGALLCTKCARAEYRQISHSIRNRLNDGWRIIGAMPDCDMYGFCDCANCGHVFHDDEQEENDE